METSDSEYFESADEDFQSDDEDTKTVKSVEESENIKDVKKVIGKFDDVKISTESSEPNLSNNNTKTDIRKTPDFKIDDENNISITSENKGKDKSDNQRKSDEKIVGKEQQRSNSTLVESSVKNKCEKIKTSDDNSWDDFELDWGKENVEEKQQTSICKETKAPKVEEKGDPLWDHSELDWGQENDEEKEQTDSQCSKKAVKNIDGRDNLWDKSELEWGKEQEEENMWGNDDWEPLESEQQQQAHKSAQSPQTKAPATNTSWGSWGSWDVSSLISTATHGVSTLTQGISTVLESGIGVPDPEEMARINHTEKTKQQEFPAAGDADKNTGFGLGNLVMGVSHFTKLVETTGTKVISGGLDTLETIGKKTMEVLQEGDPGLKKKRAFLSIDQDKPVLSQLLREAKEKAEQENQILEQKHFAKKAKNYETLFDDHQGLVHLEALEMLSKQCDIKLQTLLESYTDDTLTDMQETMDQVKELCELPDEDEDEHANWTEIKDKLETSVTEINIPISYKRLFETWEETESWLSNLKLEVCDERELHQQAIDTLAQLTAIAVEQFHKAGELLLVKEHRSTADEADSLVQLTTTLTSLIGVVAAKFSDKLNAKTSKTSSMNKDEINGLITNVFFEAANSSSYIQDAFQLLIPVLQVGAV